MLFRGLVRSIEIDDKKEIDTEREREREREREIEREIEIERERERRGYVVPLACLDDEDDAHTYYIR